MSSRLRKYLFLRSLGRKRYEDCWFFKNLNIESFLDFVILFLGRDLKVLKIGVVLRIWTRIFIIIVVKRGIVRCLLLEERINESGYLYNRILLSLKREWSINISCKMDKI